MFLLSQSSLRRPTAALIVIICNCSRHESSATFSFTGISLRDWYLFVADGRCGTLGHQLPTTYRAVYTCPCVVVLVQGTPRAYSLLRISPLMRALWAISSQWSLSRDPRSALFSGLTSSRRARGRTEKVEAEMMPMKEEQYEQRQQ